MFNLFTANTFDVPQQVQAINDILFPVVLFGVIFMFLCNIFLDTSIKSELENTVVKHDTDSQCVAEVPVEVSSVDTDDSIVLEQQLAKMVAVMEQYSQPQAKADLFDVNEECNKLRAFGARTLKAYCKEHKLKGYSSAANAGIEALAKYMLGQQVKAHAVEEFKLGSKIVA